jgi:hypothetical protein
VNPRRRTISVRAVPKTKRFDREDDLVAALNA